MPKKEILLKEQMLNLLQGLIALKFGKEMENLIAKENWRLNSFFQKISKLEMEPFHV